MLFTNLYIWWACKGTDCYLIQKCFSKNKIFGILFLTFHSLAKIWKHLFDSKQGCKFFRSSLATHCTCLYSIWLKNYDGGIVIMGQLNPFLFQYRVRYSVAYRSLSLYDEPVASGLQGVQHLIARWLLDLFLLEVLTSSNTQVYLKIQQKQLCIISNSEKYGVCPFFFR